jgi:hypothetical protein
LALVSSDGSERLFLTTPSVYSLVSYTVLCDTVASTGDPMLLIGFNGRRLHSHENDIDAQNYTSRRAAVATDRQGELIDAIATGINPRREEDP